MNAQGGNYTFALSDSGKLVRGTGASAQTFSIPTNATTAFAIGTVIWVAQSGAGVVTIGHSGVTLRSVGGAAATTSQYQKARLQKVGTDEWELGFMS